MFKATFTKFPDLLKRLIAVLLKISLESIEKFDITNTEISPETLGDKFCRLDINMKVDGQITNIEVQVEKEDHYTDRALYYWSRACSTALKEGQEYSQLPRIVHIHILNFNLFDCVEFYSEHQVLEVTRHTPLTNKEAFLFFELLKLPEQIDSGDEMKLWLALFKAQTEEELAKIEALGVPTMQQAIEAFRHVAATDEFKEMERLRSKARHNEAQALYNAEVKAKKENSIAIAKKALQMNFPINDIAMLTGLTSEEIEGLK